MKPTQRSFARLVIVLLWLAQVARGAAPAANITKQLQPERWLLVIDTSAAMERRAKAVEGVLGELLVSGMNGQMKPGAELGIWTYNKELYAGVAPMQTWEPARSNIITSRTIGFISQQPYRDKPRIENVLLELPHVVRDSRQLTLVWFSDGSQKLAGTPFDDAINTAYTNSRPALAKTRMPLVTVLRVYHGKYVGQNVSVAPWPVEFPPFPEEPEKTNAPTPPAIPAAKPVEPAKPIYISSPKKPETNAPVPAQSQSTSIKLRPPPDSVMAEATNLPSPVEVTKPTPANVVEPAQKSVPVEPAPAITVVKANPPVPTPKPVEVATMGTPQAAAVTNPPTPVARTLPPKSDPPKAPAPVVVPPQPQPITQADTVTARKWPLILGIGFMWAAVVAAILWIRRSRRANTASLITRSFDKQQK